MNKYRKALDKLSIHQPYIDKIQAEYFRRGVVEALNAVSGILCQADEEVAQLQVEMLDLKCDAMTYRKINEIRGRKKNPGCACEFDEQDNVTNKCKYHHDIDMELEETRRNLNTLIEFYNEWKLSEGKEASMTQAQIMGTLAYLSKQRQESLVREQTDVEPSPESGGD